MSKETIAKELATTKTDIESQLSVIGQAVDKINTELATLSKLEEEVLALQIAQPGWTPKFAGQPKPGTIRWGAAIGGNGDPVARHETQAGVPMGVSRTFWDMSKTASLLTRVKKDQAAGRVPWVSVKLGTSWKNVAGGAIDAALTKLFNDLKATGKPVWFTAHHEPEGGNGTAYPDEGQGSEPDWRAMQKQVRKVLDAVNAPNIAFASILMSWTWSSSSGRNPADWWVDGIWDFAGIDHYSDKETNTTMITDTWKKCYEFYKAKGLSIAIGEWGNRGTDAKAAAEMQEWYDYLVSVGSPGVCYFDSGLNAPSGSWELVGEPLNKFRELMKAPTSVRN